MPDLPTFQDLFRVGRDEALARNGSLTRDVIDRSGSDANVVVGAGAAMADEVVAQLAQVEAAVYLDSAKGQALDRLVFDRYGILRKPAGPALGSIQFTTTALTGAPFAIPLGTLVSSSDGRQFVTTAAAVFPIASMGPVTVEVRSVQAGLSQQTQANTITSLVSPISGQPTDLVVNNALATAGATDEETDDDLRNRARQFFTSARRGTLGAIQAGALAVLGVKTAAAFEVLDAYGRPAKATQLVVSDVFTDQLVSISPTPASYQAQSQVLASAVAAGLSDVRAAGINVQVTVAQVILQGMSLGLRFQAGVNADLVALQARAVVVALINALSPGQSLVISSVIEILRSVTGVIVTGQEVISPAGDVIPQQLQVLRATLGLVVVVSLQPDRALQNTTNPDAV